MVKVDLLPTEKEWEHGGYEVETVCPYAPEMGRLLTESVTAYLQGEMKSVSPDRQKGKKKH
jgi:neutral ceramidase